MKKTTKAPPVFIWWTTHEQAANIAKHMDHDGDRQIPKPLAQAIRHRAKFNAAPILFGELVNLTDDGVKFDHKQDAYKMCMTRAGIAFPRAYAPFIAAFECGLITDTRLRAVPAEDLARIAELEGDELPAASFKPVAPPPPDFRLVARAA